MHHIPSFVLLNEWTWTCRDGRAASVTVSDLKRPAFAPLASTSSLGQWAIPPCFLQKRAGAVCGLNIYFNLITCVYMCVECNSILPHLIVFLGSSLRRFQEANEWVNLFSEIFYSGLPSQHCWVFFSLFHFLFPKRSPNNCVLLHLKPEASMTRQPKRWEIPDSPDIPVILLANRQPEYPVALLGDQIPNPVAVVLICFAL